MVFLPTLPVFMEKEQEEKGGATRGTAYHRVLQLLPFERAMSRQELMHFRRSWRLRGGWMPRRRRWCAAQIWQN